MSFFEALILGIIQGLTEFLPVSSSGHIELGKYVLGVEVQQDLTFSVIVHGATVLSTVVVFWKEILSLLRGGLKFQWNPETQYLTKIFISMLPVVIVGLLWEKEVESFFDGRVFFVGVMLLVTALILFLTKFGKKNEKPVGFMDSLIIGIAQMIAILPGISRSGFTIGTALLLGVRKENATRFSFLMVLVPILGATVLKTKDILVSPEQYSADLLPLLTGFIAAFLSGLLACKWMIILVKKGKIIYFSVYCLIVGLIAIISTTLF